MRSENKKISLPEVAKESWRRIVSDGTINRLSLRALAMQSPESASACAKALTSEIEVLEQWAEALREDHRNIMQKMEAFKGKLN